MSDRQGIEIDYCPTCRGIWLDRGELDKIIERSRPAEASPTAPQPGYARAQPIGDYQPHRHGKRKKSFLEELFD
jgi:hypothetical protein